MLESSKRINDASHASLHKDTASSHLASDVNTSSSSSGGTSKKDNTIAEATVTNLKLDEQRSLFGTVFSKVKGIFTKGIELAQNFWNTPSSRERSILQANNIVIQKDQSNGKSNDEMESSNKLTIEEESIQQEQPIKREALGPNHLLDSYNKEGEYSSLLENNKDLGYDSKLIKSNFNKTR